MPRLMRIVGFVVLSSLLAAAAPAQGLKWSMLLENGGIGENTSVIFNNKLYVYDDNQGKLYHSDNAHLWYEDTGILPMDTPAQLLVFNSKLFFLSDYPRVTDNGSVWSSGFSVTPLAGDDFYFRAAVLGGKIWLYKQDGAMWNSTNGTAWQKILGAAPWASRTGFALAVVGSKLFLVGGQSSLDNSLYNDVWSTTDGINWNHDVVTAPWAGRSEAALAVYNNKLWMFGGKTAAANPVDTNEVWSSSNGVTWTKDTSRMIWSPRHGHSVISWNNIFYIIGGREWESSSEPITKQSVFASIASATDAVAGGPLAFSVERGIDATINLKVKNTGTTTWLGGAGYHRLRVVLDGGGVWNGAAAKEILIPSGTSIAPGKTYTFTIPVKTSSAASLVMQMYSPGALYFGDRLTLSIAASYAQNMMWRQIVPTGFNKNQTNNLVVFGGRLWADNQCTTDGTKWVTMSDYSKAPWLGRYYPVMAVFKDKLWVGGGYDQDWNGAFDMWSSADGVTWQNEGTTNANSEPHTQTFVFKEKIWKLYEDDYDYHVSSDGKAWTHLTSNKYSSDYIYFVFKNLLWTVGGGREDYFSNEVYNSVNGQSWTRQNDLPKMLRGQATLVYRDRIWVIGGRDYSTYDYLNNVWFSDDGKAWKEATPLPFTDYYRLRAVVYNDAIWLFVWRDSGAVEIWRSTPFEALVPSTRFIDLGMQDIMAGPSQPKSVVLYNRNTAPIYLLGAGAQFLGANAKLFQVSGADPQTPIPVGGSRTLQVTFDPIKPGLTTATLRVSYEGAYVPAIDVALTGRGALTTHDGKYMGILGYLLGYHSNKTALDINGDSKITVADLLKEPVVAIPVSSPAGRAVWPMGSTKTIRWSPAAVGGDKVDLELYRNHVYYKPIAAGEANDGSYDWVVNFGVIPGGDYTIAVISSSDSDVSGESASFFSILPETASITVKAPSGGEHWNWGDPCEIRWLAPKAMADVRLSLYKAGEFYMTLENDTPNDGSYIWFIPEGLPQASDYQIFVANPDDRDVRDCSDQTFTILKP